MGELCKLHSYRMRGGSIYQNHVENAGEPHSPAAAMYLLWCYSGEDKYDKDREKSS